MRHSSHRFRPTSWPAKRTVLATLIAAVAAISLPAVALGQSSAITGYSTPAGQVQADVSSSPQPSHSPPAASSTTAGSGQNLPFTGLDIGLLLSVGVVLLGMGLILNRAVRSETAPANRR